MHRLLFSISLVVFTLVGCAQEGPVSVNPVSGRVLYDGKPAVGVHVFLYPTSAPTIPRIPSNPHGVTDSNGNFTLTTYREGDGAAEGGYQVLLDWPDAPEGEESTGDRLLGWYDIVNSKLTAQIKPGDNKLGELQLPHRTRPPEAVQGIPGRN